MSRSLAKAANYVLLLDEVRCEGDWDAVPDYVRKIKKHSPSRLCLTLTAETELAIEKATRNTAPASRPGTTATPADNPDLAALLPKLIDAIQNETVHAQDRYQAQVCVGWLHWVVGEYDLAYTRLPGNLDDELDADENDTELEAPSPVSVTDWTRVCALKSAYLRANCLARNGKRKEALVVFEEGLPCLTSSSSSSSSSSATAATTHDQRSRKQLRYWSELFLTEFCMLFSHTLEQDEVSLRDPNCLASLRSWARYWDGAKGSAPLILGGHGFRGSVPRRRIWCEYYAVLSALVEDDLPYPTSYAPVSTSSGAGSDASARDLLRMELKKVEAVYEALLLDETSFPRAEEEREEVEEFVRLVAQNWAMMKGRGWREQDLGPGGREAMSRGVLDILYRASTKTYHSTAILRHLFNVHLAVAEFDLAFQAFDSYLGLVKKAKARVVKTGEMEPSLDEDATVLETVAQCIVALCRYGNDSSEGASDKKSAERAYALAVELEQCLHELSHALPEQADEEEAAAAATAPSAPPLTRSQLVVGPTTAGGSHNIPKRVLAAAWQAVGIAYAQWARTTFEASSRSELQAKATRCLRRSLAPEFGRSTNLRSVFSLGLLLAEQRELNAAIDLVKGALLTTGGGGAGGSGKAAALEADQQQEMLLGSYWRERAMIPLWHLLSLLLSARQDYVMAARACEGAFEQFKDPSVLFGGEALYRSEHLNEAEAAAASGSHGTYRSTGGLVDEMDDFEKERILEVKMTQLALIELLESPKVAVNASSELVSLFTRLFGTIQAKSNTSSKAGEAPRTAGGTLRGIKGALFGRGGGGPDKNGQMSPSAGKHSSMIFSDRTSRPQTMQTQASRDGGDDGHGGRRSRRSSSYTSYTEQTRSQSQSNRRHNSLRKRDRSNGDSRQRAASSGAVSHNESSFSTAGNMADGDALFTPVDDGATAARDGSEVYQFSTGRRRLSSSGGPPISMSRQASQVESLVASTSKVARSVDTLTADVGGASALVAPFEQMSLLPKFSKDYEGRRRTTILVEVWLLIAGFYRRAGMLDDAKGAMFEAQKLVRSMENDGSMPAAKGGASANNSTGSIPAALGGAGSGSSSNAPASSRDPGWAGKKSVDELWADVWTEMGHLSLARDASAAARLDFEAALTHFPDHPGAIIGLSNILLDVYSEKVLPAPAIPRLELVDGTIFPERPDDDDNPDLRKPGKDGKKKTKSTEAYSGSSLPRAPLGLADHSKKDGRAALKKKKTIFDQDGVAVGPGYGNGNGNVAGSSPFSSVNAAASEETLTSGSQLPYKATSLPLVDRLAARDRAFTLLSGLTKLGCAWNNAEAWFALARAHEESGQPDRAKEVLWWCVELEEAAAVRPWSSMATGGYIL